MKTSNDLFAVSYNNALVINQDNCLKYLRRFSTFILIKLLKEIFQKFCLSNIWVKTAQQFQHIYYS